MLDQKAITEVIEEQIHIKVQEEMELLLKDNSWSTVVEEHLKRFAQDRVAAKFASAEYLPTILKTIDESVKRLFDDGKIDDFIGLVDEHKLNQLVDDKVSPIIDEYIEKQFGDPDWLTKIQSISNHSAMVRAEKELAKLDIDSKISQMIDVKLDNKIKSIEDKATSPQLTILDDIVVNEHEFVTDSITVISDATINKSLTVNDLIIRGRVNTDNSSWSELSNKIKEETVDSVRDDLTDIITNSVLTTVQKKGIQLKDIKIGKEKLIDDGMLSSAITKSSLERVGLLQGLTVIGSTSLNETVTVSRGKLGINTDTPSSALDIWDGEVQITLGKKQKDTGYIGLNRKGTLEIGTDNNAITIDPEGKTKINKLMIGRNNISWSSELPGFSGQKGDIVFNMDPDTNNEIGWQCLGQFLWRKIS